MSRKLKFCEMTRITCNLYEYVCKFTRITISHSVFLGSVNVSDEVIEKIKTTFYVQKGLSKTVPFMK
jgi:hypothetical protein